MMPAYRNMDSYPYQTNQIPFPYCYYHPGIEAIPPHQLKLDPSKSPFPYEQTWPYAGSFGQSIPIHSCCGHTNFPGCCNYRPYPPHASAPSQIYHSGCYPAYGDPFYVPYSPQPQYTMELPRYEYDKYMPRYYHCCGCANHPCNQKEAPNVKIEERESDVGKKVNDALVPIQMKNYPYPFVLIPPEYASNRDLGNSVRAEATEQDKMSHEKKSPGPGYFRADAQEPRVWNGWLPVDMNGAPNIVHEGDGRRNQNLETENNRRESDDGRTNQKPQGEHRKPEFPFPIIWMPCYNKQEEEGGRTNNQESASTPKCIEEVPSTFKSVPANSHVDEVVTKETKSNQDKSTNESGSDIAKKVANERIIPVQQMELYQGKDDSEGSGKKVRNIPVKQWVDVVKNSSDISRERQSTSPRKTSKLPPVCLRVDPLPRKKNGGSSRSPSPPASKGHSQSAAGETSNTPSGGMNEKVQPNSNCQNATSINDKDMPKEKTIQVSENKTNGSSQSPRLPASKEHPQATDGETTETSGAMNDKAQPNLQNAPSISEKVMPQEKTIQVTENRTSEHRGVESYTDGDKQEIKAEKRARNMMEDATDLKDVRDSSKPTDEGRKQVKVLSDVDAAVLIQAAYRGYQVRKWEPVKKLKQLAEVSKEVTDVKGRVQAFEDSSNLKSDDKQRIAIGETIMTLLLKLDTIQGLHSIFREIRKSLARELISLQERLDSIKTMKPLQQMQELIASKPAENTAGDEQNGEYVQDQQQEVAVPREDSSVAISQEECQDQSCMKDCINSLAAADGGSESQSSMDPTSDEGTQPVVLPNDMVNKYVSHVVTVNACNSTSDLSEADKTAVEHEAKSNMNDIPIVKVDKSDMTTWKELPVGAVDEDTAEKEKVEDMDTVYDEMIELPVGLLDEDTATPEFEKHNETEVSIGELGAEDEECIVELPVGLLDDDTAAPDLQKDYRTDISEEEPQAEDGECVVGLPVGLLDEDGIAKSESEKRGETKISEEVQPDEGNTESSSTDDTAKEIQVEQQQQLEDQEEVQSSGESNGWVKVEFQKEGELRGDATLDLKVEPQSEEKMIANDTEVPTLISQLNCHEQENGDECLAVNDAENIQPEPLETMISSQEDVPIQCEEKVAQRETQVVCQDLVVENNEKLAKEETELHAASHASKELPVSNGDTKLLEENEKLRKMMKKLLDAGNEQLNVISNLTGRVKGLEKKLARSKKVRSKRYKPAATSKFRSNNAPQH